MRARHKAEVVDKAVARFQGKVSDRNAAIGQDVRVALIAHCPTGLGEQAIDIFPGFVFGGGHLVLFKTCADFACANLVQDLSWRKLQAV